MKTFILIILISLPLFSSGQNKSIKGNGRIVKSQKVLPAYDALFIDLFCDVYVTVGSMPKVEISGDKNTINKISLEVKNKELRIQVKEGFWLQASRPQIYLQTPYLTKITTKGHQTNIGIIKVEGIAVDQFETDLLFGDVELQGTANKLLLRSSNRSYYKNRSTLDASSLVVNEVEATIQGSNSAKVFATERLIVTLKHDAVLEYKNEPIEVTLKDKAVQVDNGIINVKGIAEEQESANEALKERTTLQYVELKVKNNSLGRKHFIIKGLTERGRNLSYGFPMLPLATRSKKVPVGTKMFLQNSGITKKKLITFTADDEGKVVNLFTK
ncbi:MAG: hypothetical protein ACJA01_003461 [Saprospiraceae bacterium]|jgi:hypothetical protein